MNVNLEVSLHADADTHVYEVDVCGFEGADVCGRVCVYTCG